MTRAVLECTCSVFFREDADGEAVEVASHFGHVIGTMSFCEGNKKKNKSHKSQQPETNPIYSYTVDEQGCCRVKEFCQQIR